MNIEQNSGLMNLKNLLATFWGKFTSQKGNVQTEAIIQSLEARIDRLEEATRSFLVERLTEERLFREDFGHALKRELLDDMERQLKGQQHPISYPLFESVFIHTADGHRVLLDAAEPYITMHVLEHGVWETHVRSVLDLFLKEGGHFLDVGANIGLHTLYAAKLVGPNGRIMAVEPFPRLVKMLTRNIDINGLQDRVTIIPAAITNVADQEVSFDYLREHPAMSGLTVPNEVKGRFDGSVERISVPTKTIDSLLGGDNAVDLIKIDVEGFELHVIEGATNTINKHKNTAFLLEWVRTTTEATLGSGALSAIMSRFRNAGYAPYRTHGLPTPQAISYEELAEVEVDDVLFVHPDNPRAP